MSITVIKCINGYRCGLFNSYCGMKITFSDKFVIKKDKFVIEENISGC